MQTKVCSKCGQALPATTEYFHKNKKGKYELDSKCKLCCKLYYENNSQRVSERNKKYRQENIEIVREYHRQYYHENSEDIKDYDKKRYNQNKEKHQIRGKIYRDKNKEKIAIIQKVYYDKNKDKLSSYHKNWWEKYYEENKEEEVKRKIQYFKDNPEMVRRHNHLRISRLKKVPFTLTIGQWEDTKKHFNNRCGYCGKELSLEQDHLIAVSKGGGTTLNNIIPACRTCNASKGNKDFFEWYPKYKYYSKKREKFLLEFLGQAKEVGEICG